MSDPLLDWLKLYGQSRGFVPDNLREGYEPATEMHSFLREKGIEFEAHVVRNLEARFGALRIAGSSRAVADPTLYEATLDAMRLGAPILLRPVLWDAERSAYGIPSLLVRSDLLNQIAANPVLSVEESIRSAPLLEGAHHYRVVDIRFTSLALNGKGRIGNDNSARRRKAQLLVCNRALGQMQGWEPWAAYVIGRGWSQGRERGDSCLDRLGIADMTDPLMAKLVDEASAWVRRVRSEGSEWEVLPTPTVKELYPNMGNIQDAPWHLAKKEIAEELGELTQLWWVTPRNRPHAHAAGVFRIEDAACHSGLFELKDTTAAKLHAIIETNRPGRRDLVRPDHVRADEETWRKPKALEFFVDFETVSDLDDRFSRFPAKAGQALIFMVGCGHVEDGRWQFRVFTCDHLTEPCEARMLEEWLVHMESVRQRLMPEDHPLVFHWSHAENSTLNNAYNSARNRHRKNWPNIRLYDFLTKVVLEEPVTVKGAYAFGLKVIATAMHRNGLIQTEWTNGPGDGLAAMIGAWRCDATARRRNCSMCELPLMQSIEEYNEVDCRTMQEIVAYLRDHP